MMPQIRRRMPRLKTRNFSRRAKSTRYLIMCSLVLHRVRELQRVGYDLVARCQPAKHFLKPVARDRACLDFQPPEAFAAFRDENPVFVVQAKDGRGWHDGPQLLGL